MDMLYKSCSVFTRNTTKLGLHFSDVSTIFYEFYKIQHLHLDLEETILRTGPRILQTSPRDEKLDCNWVPGSMAGGGSSIPVRGRLGSVGKGRGSAQGAHLRPIPGVGRLRGRAGEGARRHQTPAAAAIGLPTDRSLGLGHTRPGEL
jgi:hypothetical protein